MVKKTLISILGLIIISCFTANVFAEGLSPQLCKDKVITATKLIAAEGEAAFAKIKDPEGEFRFAGGQGYIWIQDLNPTMIMHPIKPSLDGKDLSTLQDKNGVLFFIAFNEIAEENAAGGWVGYLWPKPGAKEVSPKVSFVKLVEYNGKEYVAGSGMYDVTSADIKKQFPKDAVYED